MDILKSTIENQQKLNVLMLEDATIERKSADAS